MGSRSVKQKLRMKHQWDLGSEQVVEELSQDLCPLPLLEMQAYRQRSFLNRGMKHIRVFPVWRRYRWQAQKIARIQNLLPFLRFLPLKVSEVLGNTFLK